MFQSDDAFLSAAGFGRERSCIRLGEAQRSEAQNTLVNLTHAVVTS